MFEVVPPMGESPVSPEVLELQATVRHIYGQLKRYETKKSLLQKHGFDHGLLNELKRLGDINLEEKEHDEIETWKMRAEAVIDGVFPLLQEAKELHQAYQGRLEKLREWNRLADVEKLDVAVLDLLPEGTTVEKRLEIAKKMERFRTGREVGRRYLGIEGSLNASSYRELEVEGGTRIGVFGKERLKEATFSVSQAGVEGDVTTVNIFREKFNPQTNEFDLEAFDLATLMPADSVNEYKLFLIDATSPVFREAVTKYLAEGTDIDPSDIAYDNDTFNARLGILPGESTVREWFQSRMDLLMGFEVVPFTTMQAEPDAHDISSIQEDVRAIHQTDPPARQMEWHDAEWFFNNPPDKWIEFSSHAPLEAKEKEERNDELVRSLVRSGVMAYLMEDLDGILRNIMINPVTGRVWKIDNGLSMGVVTGQVIEYGPMGTEKKYHQVKELIGSVSLEIVMKHKLRLDDEAQKNVRDLYENLSDEGSKQSQYVRSLFGLVFKRYGDVIAKKQLDKFISRLHQIAVHGYPPELIAEHDYEPLITPIDVIEKNAV